MRGDCTFVTKERPIWHPRSLQMLREKAAADYALRAVPPVVDGTAITFPATKISVGHHVHVESRRIQGQPLLEMLYIPEKQSSALEMAVVALKAFEMGNVRPEPFVLFSRGYLWVRKAKVSLSKRAGACTLSRQQRAVLLALVASYIKTRPPARVLVHGDLHAGNIIVNSAEKMLGIVDLELLHVGKLVTNLAQLWISFHWADPELGRMLYRRYTAEFPEISSGQADTDMRAEIALRCWTAAQEGIRWNNAELEQKSILLLQDVLSCDSFAQFVLRDSAHC